MRQSIKGPCVGLFWRVYWGGGGGGHSHYYFSHLVEWDKISGLDLEDHICGALAIIPASLLAPSYPRTQTPARQPAPTFCGAGVHSE